MKINFKKRGYNVCLDDWIRIQILKCKLKFIRIYRWIKRFIKEFYVYLFIITILWLIFFIIVYSIDKANNTLLGIIWSNKTPVYSTIIVAGFLSWYHKKNDYKKKIRMQHFLYVEALHEFEKIISVYVKEEMFLHFYFFYNDLVFTQGTDFLKNQCNYMVNNNQLLNNHLKLLRDYLLKIKDYVLEGKIFVNTEYSLIDINSAIGKIDCIKKNKKFDISKDIDEFIILLINLHSIIEELQSPWRKDLKIDLKIINILLKENQDMINSNFYISMLINGFDFTPYENDSILSQVD